MRMDADLLRHGEWVLELLVRRLRMCGFVLEQRCLAHDRGELSRKGRLSARKRLFSRLGQDEPDSQLGFSTLATRQSFP